MASNYVEIKVKASDEAKPDLEALKFELDSIGAKVETAKIDVDDKDAAAKLLSLNARLAALDKKVSNPRLSASGAAKVEADIAFIDAALDKLNDKHADPKVALDGAAKVLAEVEALDHEMDKLNDKGGGLTSMFDKLGSSLSGLTVPLPLLGDVGLPALAAMVPVAAALLVEVTGLASGFAAAAAGAGAFGLLAMPAVKSVEAAYTSLSAAQQKYQDAQAKYNEDPTKANAKALQSAAQNLDLVKEKLGQLPAAEREALSGLAGLRQEFSKLSTAFQPEAFKVFAAGLGLVKTLLPQVVPFANTFADVMAKLLTQASKFASSKGFSDWLKQFHSLEGPALNSIAQGIANVANAFGKLMTTMSGKDVAHAINIAFAGVTGVINAVAASVKFLMQVWDGAGVAFATGAHAIASRFDEIRHAAAAWVSDMAHDVAQVVTFFATLPGKITAVFASAGSWLVKAGGNIVDGLIKGLEAKIPGLQTVVNKIVNLVKSVAGYLGIKSPSTVMFGYGVSIMDGLIGGIGSRFGGLRSQMGQVSSMIGGVPGGGPGYGGRGGAIQLQVAPGGGSAFEQFMVTALRQWVRVRGGGNVQSAFGRS